MPVSLCASRMGPSCQGGPRSLAPGPLTSSSLRSTRRTSPKDANVMSLLALPGRLLSPLPPGPCSSAHAGMDFLGRAQPLQNRSFLACCLRRELRACGPWQAGCMPVTCWGATTAGCCAGKRVTATTDRVTRRQHAITNHLLPRSFLQSQNACRGRKFETWAKVIPNPQTAPMVTDSPPWILAEGDKQGPSGVTPSCLQERDGHCTLADAPPGVAFGDASGWTRGSPQINHHMTLATKHPRSP